MNKLAQKQKKDIFLLIIILFTIFYCFPVLLLLRL